MLRGEKTIEDFADLGIVSRPRLASCQHSPTGERPMILEGIITTVDDDGRPHLSAMGPEVDSAFSRFELRPFPSSRTCQNLRRDGQAVFHVTDDVELLAAIVVDSPPPNAILERAKVVDGYVLTNACRAYELNVLHQDFTGPRGLLVCEVASLHRIRDFFGFNRAKHAVVEAAILATRLGFLPQVEIETKWNWLAAMVEKTGENAERRAFKLLTAFVEKTHTVTTN